MAKLYMAEPGPGGSAPIVGSKSSGGSGMADSCGEMEGGSAANTSGSGATGAAGAGEPDVLRVSALIVTPAPLGRGDGGCTMVVPVPLAGCAGVATLRPFLTAGEASSFPLRVFFCSALESCSSLTGALSFDVRLGAAAGVRQSQQTGSR